MRSWLIIGGSGYIGSSLAGSIKRNFPLEKIILPSRKDLAQVMSFPNKYIDTQQGSVNVVILAAAGVNGVIEAQGVEFNSSWVPAAAIAMARLPNVSVLVAGSSFEYGTSGKVDDQLDPVSSKLAPVDSYGISKRDGFEALRPQLSSLTNLGYARIFQVWGGSEHPLRLAPSLIANALRSKVTTLTSGSAIRDFIHVEDVSTQILDYFTFLDMYPQIFNICSGAGLTVKEFSSSLLSSHNYDPNELLESSDCVSHPYPKLVGAQQPLLGSWEGLGLSL
jgi:nucleoside-diphosphate-sugar epimerase